MLVKNLLLGHRPTAAKTPSHTQLVRQISETVIAKQKNIIRIFKRTRKPFTGCAHVVDRVMEIVEVVTKEHGGRSTVRRANTVH